MIKYTISALLKFLFSNSIVGRPLKGTSRELFYERSQHLIFAFKRKLSYEPIIQNKVAPYIKDGDLVFDIGGNIGQYLLLFSELVGVSGRVVSIEPDSKNFTFLQFNVNINKILNTIILNTGLDKSTSILNFYRDTETGGRKGSFKKEFVESSFNGQIEEVNTITFDSLIDIYGKPQFVKIDVEGYEVNVLEGLTYALESTVFLVEVRSETKYDVFNYFRSKSYICYYIDKKEDILIHNASDIPNFANLIFKKENLVHDNSE